MQGVQDKILKMVYNTWLIQSSVALTDYNKLYNKVIQIREYKI